VHRDQCGQEAMIRILFRVEARPGQRDKLIKFLKWDQKESMNREPGTVCFDFFQDPDNANGFYVYEAYKDASAFKTHQKHKPYKRWSSHKFKSEVRFPHRKLRRLGR
jgi:quinol monooxygenase YgiN